MNIKSKSAIYIFSFLIFLQGCAVLTLDVDVYKGPLANDSDVLTQQTTVMATGAKPLLIKLRDTLEETCIERRITNASIWSPISFKHKANDSDGFITNYPFCSNDAKTVNQILSLYQDRHTDHFNTLIQTGKKSIKDFYRSQLTLFPISNINGRGETQNKKEEERLETIWNNYSKTFKPEIIKALNGMVPKACGGDLILERAKLAKAYEGFIKGNYRAEKKLGTKTILLRNVEGIFKAQKCLEELLEKTEDEEKWPDYLRIEIFLDTASDYSITSQYKALAENSDLVRFHTDQIFANTINAKNLKSDFALRVQQASQSFFDSLTATRELLDTSLHLILLLDIENDKNLKEQYLSDAVHLAINLIHPKRLWKALNTVDSTKNETNTTIFELLEAIKDNANVTHFKNDTEYKKLFPEPDPENSKHLKAALTEILLNKNNELGQTYRFAQALMELNQRYINTEAKENRRPLMGIALGPIDAHMSFKKAARIAKNLSSKLEAGGLERGRLDTGLDQLIEDYLNETRKYPRNEILVEKNRKQLFEALVRFAQKVLFIANNQSWFNNVPCINHTESEQGCSQNNTQMSVQNKADISKYTQVLQAVGNSILFQVDELVHDAKYNQGLKSGGPGEAWALESALPRYSTLVLDKLIKSLDTEVRFQTDVIAINTNIDATKKELIKAKSDEVKKSDALNALQPNSSTPEKIEEAKKQLEDAKSSVKDLEKKITKAGEKVKSATAKKKRFDDTVKAVEDVRPLVIKTLNTTNLHTSPSIVNGQIKLALQIKKQSESDKYAVALEIINDRLPQMEFPLPPVPPNLNSKQVMDQLIDTLKYEHIVAVREGGENSGQVKYLQEALDAAHNHRADMVAIRPTFAYLRNSFPSTSLQNDANLGWKNLLSESIRLANIPIQLEARLSPL